MIGKKNWYGKEVEGRLYGLNTKFIRYEVGELDPYEVQHLYFTREFLETEGGIEQIEFFCINSKYMISVECNKNTFNLLTPNIKVRAHLIYRVVEDNIFKLKETDSIFIDTEEPYNVLCFTKHNSLKVTPNDYSNDKL